MRGREPREARREEWAAFGARADAVRDQMPEKLMEIEDPSGRIVATVRKAMITPLRERFSIDVEARAVGAGQQCRP